MGANAPLNGALVSGKDIEDMPAPNGVEDEGSHAGVDNSRGVSHQGMNGGEGRNRALGIGTVQKI